MTARDEQSLACRWASLEPQPTARAPASQTASASSSLAGALGQRAERDRVGELRDGIGVAERHQPRQADRVEPVAGQQPQVGIGHAQRRAASP